ncbi:MAG: prepilin-type N-terminal cleavage/methylation domain-containing protein [Oscillospiraceae bacterium]|nr:prepilin-type N-terminal cleavage/methylation domain-containing protein [Oscillospiraceae bacterium]
MFKNILRKREKGFTLIEMVIVLAIIVVILTFLVPKISAYINQSRGTKATHIAKQIQSVVVQNWIEGKDNMAEKLQEFIDPTAEASIVSSSSDQVSVTFKCDSDNYIVNVQKDSGVLDVQKQ